MRLTTALLTAGLTLTSVADAAPLTLEEAFARVEATHPELKVFAIYRSTFLARSAAAGQSPARVVGSTVENVLGNHGYGGLDAAEVTFTIGSVLERGDKLEARRALAHAQIDSITVDREIKRLDLLAETARRYLQVVEAGSKCRIFKTAVEERKRAASAAERRLAAGAGQESDLWISKAATAKAEIVQLQCELTGVRSSRQLGALWGEPTPGNIDVPLLPVRLPELNQPDQWTAETMAAPTLARFANETHIREARVRLASADRTPDLQWQIGLRRLEATDGFGLVGSVSLPLGSRARAQPGIDASRSELAALEIEREVTELTFETTLAMATDIYQSAARSQQQWEEKVLPLLDQAARAAASAYEAGAASALEWHTLQTELIDGQLAALEEGLRGQRALIEIERLLGRTAIGPILSGASGGSSPSNSVSPVEYPQ